jgi:tRNA A-37 threonylcarbamoyl transferase component Bud32
VVDGFVIEAVAGRGGMGVVYRARQRKPDRLVALKLIAPELAGDPAFRARFERESTIAAQIEHPNVIPVHAVGEDGGVLFIAMRFVPGIDLRSLIAQEGRLEPRRAAGIVDQVAQALDAAHAHGLVHRDVKPANILIAGAGGRDHAYLTDFGLSRHVEGSQGITGSGAFLGTIDYVAPEQARAERVDARTDVYSLGCVLFHALTGTVPFPLTNDLAKLYAHGTQQPPSVCERAPGVPPAFDPVLARAMAKAPEDRYLSAGDLGRAATAAATNTALSRTETNVAVGAAAPATATAVATAAVTRPGPDAQARTVSTPEPAARSAAAGGAAGRAPRSRRPRPGTRWGVAVAVALVGAVVAALVTGGSGGSPGHAAPKPPGAGVTGSDNSTHQSPYVLANPSLALRRRPAVSAPVAGRLPYRTPVAITCTEIGDPVTAPLNQSTITTPLWDRVRRLTGTGPVGFAPDGFIQTGTPLPVARPCQPVPRHPDAAAPGVVLLGPALAVRQSPSLAAPVLGQLPVKTAAVIVCTAIGDAVSRTFGSHPITTPVWDGVRAHTAGRTLGFVPDAFMQTGSDGPVAPPCP